MNVGDRSRLRRALASFRRNRRASSAVEFALVATPFVFTLLAILQMGIYYMTQSSLDAGVIAEADALNRIFLSQSSVPTLTTATLQTQIAGYAGGMINANTLLVDLQPFYYLKNGPVSIGGPTPDPIPSPDPGSKGTCSSQSSCGGDILALRAQSQVVNFISFVPRLQLIVRSAVLVRRQSQ